MLMTFGIFMLLLGGILMSLAFPAMIVQLVRGRSFASSPVKIIIKLLLASIFLLMFGIAGIHYGRENGTSFVSIGVAIFFVGLLIIVLGSWIAFWAPLSLRNTNKGMQFLITGLFLVVVGIIVMSAMSSERFQINSVDIDKYSHTVDWEYIFSRRFGPIPFGLLVLAIMIFANGLALRNRLRFGRFIGCNLLVIALLTLVYALGPTLFRAW